MPDPNHDPDVAYADVVVPGHAIDLSGWECWTVHDGGVLHYYARGPCPVCRAPTQGHLDDATRPIESLGRPSDEETPGEPRPSHPIEIPVRCTCGHAHGRDQARSCGRRWSILCPPDQP
jgi:hypothetical protein